MRTELHLTTENDMKQWREGMFDRLANKPKSRQRSCYWLDGWKRVDEALKAARTTSDMPNWQEGFEMRIMDWHAGLKSSTFYSFETDEVWKHGWRTADMVFISPPWVGQENYVRKGVNLTVVFGCISVLMFVALWLLKNTHSHDILLGICGVGFSTTLAITLTSAWLGWPWEPGKMNTM